MQQKNQSEEIKKAPSRTKERIRFFILGFLAAAVIASAVFIGLPHLQGGLAEESPAVFLGEAPVGFMGEGPEDLLFTGSSMQLEYVTDFNTDVLQSSDTMLLLILKENMDWPAQKITEMSDMAASVNSGLGFAFKQYLVGNESMDIQSLGVQENELPVLAVVHEGNLLGKLPILNVAKADTVLNWAKGLKPKPLPVFYRMFPESVTSKGATSSYGHALGEVSLFSYNFTVEGYKQCNAISLQASNYASLYELLGKPQTNADGTFALPDYTSLLPNKYMSYGINVTGNPPKEDSAAKKITAGGITYIQQPLNRDVELFLGEIILAANLSQDDMDHWGLMPCNGATLKIYDHPPLFALLNTYYGGDSTVRFCLPNLSAATPPIPGTSYYIATEGIFPSRE